MPPSVTPSSASDAACILATWFSSVRDVCDEMRERKQMRYGQVWLGKIGCILFTSFDLSPATSLSNAAITAPCGPPLAPASRALVLSISHRSRDFVHWERLLDVRLVAEFIACARALVNHLLALSAMMPVRGQAASAELHVRRFRP
jgi:hypothetical protein